MQFSSHLLVKTYIVIYTATSGSCWQYFTSLSDLKMINSQPEYTYVHSEYLFGQCQRGLIRVLYAHVHLDHINLLGKTIVRGWIDIKRIPTCILMRAMSFDVDFMRSTAYRFQMCVPRISYCHSQEMYKYYFYELYVPEDVIGGMDWDLYFLGPPGTDWLPMTEILISAIKALKLLKVKHLTFLLQNFTKTLIAPPELHHIVEVYQSTCQSYF